jgi:SAM-dependent methyltransferase
MSFNNKAYWEERLKSNYDLIGVGDISLTMNYNVWSYRITRHRLSAIFRKYAPSGAGNVLDIGAGTGFVVDIWDRFGKSVTGIDISATAVSKLSERFPRHRFIELDAGAEEMPFADNSMEVVSASSVLYHIVDDAALAKLLGSVHRVLKPGGYFIFSDNFIHGQIVDIQHQKCRTLEDYEQAVTRSGFTIVDRVANYVLFNDPVDARGRFFPRLWGFITNRSRRWPWFDKIIWPVLYPLEYLLTAVVKESPAQEIMICQVKK